MTRHGFEALTLSLLAFVQGCATQDVKSNEQPGMVSAPATSKGGVTMRVPPSADECEATFRLCASNVKGSSAVDNPLGGYSVAISLTEEGRESFEAFSKTWLKRTACVTLGSERLIKAKIQGVINSGQLTASRPTAQEAEELVQKLSAAPKGPCGP
jgi:preprotein translocase subunit SecD